MNKYFIALKERYHSSPYLDGFGILREPFLANPSIVTYNWSTDSMLSRHNLTDRDRDRN